MISLKRDVKTNKLNKRKIIFFLPLLFLCSTLLSSCNEVKQYKTLSEMDGKNIGLLEGTPMFMNLVNEHFPNSKSVFFGSYSEAVASVNCGKIAGFVIDYPTYVVLQKEHQEITKVDEPLTTCDYGIPFRKNIGNNIVADFNNYIDSYPDELNAIKNKWLSDGVENVKTNKDDLNPSNPHFKVGAVLDQKPFSFVKDSSLEGLDIDIIVQFSKRYNYYPEFLNADTRSLFLELELSKYDCVTGGICVTDERLEKYDFVFPTIKSEVIVATHNDSAPPTEESNWFIDGFKKTFIDENRWLSFLSGIGRTLAITVSAIIAGTILGYFLYLLAYRSKIVEKIINGVCIFMGRTPVVVLLMIFYYIFFGSTSVDALVVSIICFTCLFSCTMYGMIKQGVQAVNRGQYEAAIALGYTKLSAFTKIIFPQAVRMFVSRYKDEVVSLIKGTAVVGYITVLDLTKVSDVIRSLTFEAFFPLISSAIIYFLLATLLIFAVNLIDKLINPMNRKEEKILKGVNVDDKDMQSK